MWKRSLATQLFWFRTWSHFGPSFDVSEFGKQQKFPHGDLRLFWSRKLKFWDLHIFSIYFNVFGVSVHIVYVFSNHIHWYIDTLYDKSNKITSTTICITGKIQVNLKISLGCFLSQSWFSHLLSWWYEGKCYFNIW